MIHLLLFFFLLCGFGLGFTVRRFIPNKPNEFINLVANKRSSPKYWSFKGLNRKYLFTKSQLNVAAKRGEKMSDKVKRAKK